MFWGFLKQSVLIVAVSLLFGSNSASALGQNPVISHLKTGESGFASHEFIAFYNNSSEQVDVTDWCVYYASQSDSTKTKLGCIETIEENVTIFLEPFSYAILSTQDFADSIEGFSPDIIFNPGISGTAGHIRLLNTSGDEVDKIGWGAAVSPENVSAEAHQSGYALVRKAIPETNFLQDTDFNHIDFAPAVLGVIPASGLIEVENIDLCSNLEGFQGGLPDDYYFDELGLCVQDQCDNLEGLQAEIPDGYISSDGENCIEDLLSVEYPVILITELLPNAASVDTGQEFIELFNPNDSGVNLNGYKIELGPAYSKNYIFENTIIDPYSYVSFSDILTGITLPNGSADLRLVAPNNEVVSQTESYDDPKDDQSWALINDVWQYTALLTPGEANSSSSDVTVTLASSQADELEDCGPGRFRNPATNRCKSITSGDQELTPCDEGQYRNPETNRCKSTTASSSLVPCKPGQERNPETNRCRSVVSTASALKACAVGQERNPDTNRCRKVQTLGASTLTDVQDVPSESSDSFNLMVILGIIIFASGYAIYEWRGEIKNYFLRFRTNI